MTSRIPYKGPYVVKSQLVEQNDPFLINEIACTNQFGLKFCVSAGFGHGVPHTKFQPLRLKDAEGIGWCG